MLPARCRHARGAVYWFRFKTLGSFPTSVFNKIRVQPWPKQRMETVFPSPHHHSLSSSSSSWPSFNCASFHNKVLSTEPLLGPLSRVIYARGFFCFDFYFKRLHVKQKKILCFFGFWPPLPPGPVDFPAASTLLKKPSTGGPWGSCHCSLLGPFLNLS